MPEEDDIQRNGSAEDYRRLLVNILSTNNWLNQLLIAFFKEPGLTLQQYHVLNIVRGQCPEPVCLGQIQEQMIDRNSNVTRLIDKLIEKGLVTRDICSLNRRMIDVHLTEKGHDVLAAIDEKFPELYKQFQTLNAEETVLLNRLLDKLRG